ncbi:MAG: secretin N-terminal domain-containing protein [candidate division FCPU426 bacterium]
MNQWAKWGRLFLLPLAVAASLAWAQEDGEPEEAASGPLARLTQVAVQSEAGQPVVKLMTNQQVASTMSYLRDPDRLLIKLKDTMLVWRPSLREVNQPPLRRIRSAQHGNEVWVVLDLNEPVRWQRQTQSRGITLRLEGSREAEAEAIPTARPAAAGVETAGAAYQVADIAVESEEDKVRLVITTDGQARYRLERDPSGRQLTLSLHSAALSWSGPVSGLPLGPVQRVTARQEAAAGESVVRIRVQLADAAPYLVFQDQNQVILELESGDAGMVRGRRGNLLARVSVDLQAADVGAVLRALAQDAGFDLVFTPAAENLSGPQALVTLSINEQPLRSVLDFVLKPRRLAYAVSGNTLRIGLATEFPLETKVFTLKNLAAGEANLVQSLEASLTEGTKGKVVVDAYSNRVVVSAIPSDLAAVESVLRRMDVERRLVSRAFVLNYTQAERLRPLVQPALSPLGTMQENTGENSLVVTDIPGNLNAVARLIRSLDTKAEQVMIEARIVEVGRTDEMDLGIRWDATNQAGHDPQLSISSNPRAVNAVGRLTVGTLPQGWNLNATLSALEAKGKVNILSNPRIATLNNQSATLSASQNLPYTTSLVSNGVVSTQVNYLELPISLTVTPQITKDRNVLLGPMTLTVTTVTGPGTPPPTSTRTASTQMQVQDGETIAIGGMVRDEESTDESKVPLLGDIPLLGALFRSTVVNKKKVELVVFLTTHILE